VKRLATMPAAAIPTPIVGGTVVCVGKQRNHGRPDPGSRRSTTV
jgi:hypothetical protein